MRRGVRGRAVLVVVAAVVIASSSVLSTSTPAYAGDPKVDAEQAFREGRTLLAAGDLERACSKFSESQKLDPAAGTLLNLGECLDKRGMAASARAVYLEAAKAATLRGRTDWERLATSRANALEKEVSIVMLVVNPSARVKDLAVTRDGVKEEWNKPVQVDAGSHVIEATAPGHRPWSAKVTVGKASAIRVEIPKLDEEGGGGVSTGITTGPNANPNANPVPATDDGGASQRNLGIIAGGVGLAALVFGGITGLVAKGKHDDAVRLCPSYPNQCGGEGETANDTAKDFATFSTVGFVAGAVLIATGAVLYFTAPSRSTVSSSSRTRGWTLSVSF